VAAANRSRNRWTDLLHAWLKREGIDFPHSKNENGQKVIVTTPNGVEKYWELSRCLKRLD
jgi:Protein of unknown function (DUF3644)